MSCIRPRAPALLTEVRSILSLDRERPWKVPIVLTEAHRGENVPELWTKIEEHRSFLEREGGLEERRRRNLASSRSASESTRGISINTSCHQTAPIFHGSQDLSATTRYGL